MTSKVERAARLAWGREAAQLYFGTCDGCGRNRDSDGSFLLVARQKHSSKRLCLRCWEERQK